MSGNKPLVSVIFPAYNHEKYVQETIKSVIYQTYENIELLILDDGSPDSTWQKIQEMKEECEKRFTRVVFETRENGGVCSALNRLYELAQGEYILQTASDDLLKPKLVEKEIDFLINNPDYVLCTCDDEIIDSDSKKCYWDEERNNIYDVSKAVYKTFGDYLKQSRPEFDFNSEKYGMYSSLYCGNHITNGWIIKRDIWNKVGPYPEGVLEDWWLMLQLSKYGKFKYIDEVLYSYRWHNNNVIRDSIKIKGATLKAIIWELSYLHKINEENSFDKFAPDVKDIYENNAKNISVG